MIRHLLTVGVALVLLGAAPVGAKSVSNPVVSYWESDSGERDGHAADLQINPASVVKLATTLWAIEELGPDRRFATRIRVDGEVDHESGTLNGDLIVVGGGDPDFHIENAQWVAEELAAVGVHRISGALWVDRGFWIGWEGGSRGRKEDPAERAAVMARRLAKAWDPTRWTASTIRSVADYRRKRGLKGPARSLSVGRVGGLASSREVGEEVLVHRSNRLRDMLKRFNDYSNNDIERLAYHLGDAEAMTAFFVERWSDEAEPPTFASLSGLGSNRMTPRQVVRLLGELEKAAEGYELEVSELMPLLGCGRNTLKNYAGLEDPFPDGSLVAKTGTLAQTDGGVVTLAGIVGRDGARVRFFLATVNNGAAIRRARNQQVKWLAGTSAHWDPRPSWTCPADSSLSYSDVTVRVVRP